MSFHSQRFFGLSQMLHAIFAYIWVILGVNVGKYSIHRAYFCMFIWSEDMCSQAFVWLPHMSGMTFFDTLKPPITNRALTQNWTCTRFTYIYMGNKDLHVIYLHMYVYIYICNDYHMGRRAYSPTMSNTSCIYPSWLSFRRLMGLGKAKRCHQPLIENQVTFDNYLVIWDSYEKGPFTDDFTCWNQGIFQTYVKLWVRSRKMTSHIPMTETQFTIIFESRRPFISLQGENHHV